MRDVSRYSVAGRSGATAGTIDHCIGALWNPHATKTIWVVSVEYSKLVGAVTGWEYAARTTTKGTVGSTITPDIDNDHERLVAPISGAVLDLAAYSVQPTREGPDSFHFMSSGANAGAIHELWFNEPIAIPHGTGLGIFQGTASTRSGDITFVWDE
jgi:hypothetical protein